MESIEWQERSRRLIGDDGTRKLGQSHVMIFGLGGVGSFAAEALARSGVGALSLVDYDTVSASNRNRQLPALVSTVGSLKIDVVAARLRDIHPDIRIVLHPVRMRPDNLAAILQGEGGAPDFIADAIDDLPAKTALILEARKLGIPIISSMGAGYRLDPSMLAIGDISETHTCPLARILRRNLREAGVQSGVPVVWSKEPPIAAAESDGVATGPASMVFVPGAAGLLMASYIVRQMS